MKCIQCSHEMADGAKFCSACGSKQELNCGACRAALSPSVRFCPECGVKAGAAVYSGGTEASEVASIDLVPSPLGLAECPITIKKVSAEGPDGIGDLSITVKYEVTNGTDEDWEYLDVRSQLLTAAGHIVDESSNIEEQTVSAGEGAEFETSFWSLKAKLLGTNPERAHVIISAVACGLAQQKLGEIAIPVTPMETVPLKPGKLGDAVQFISGSLWKSEPDDDKECCVEVKLLLQNLTKLHLPQVRLIAEVTDKSDRDVTDAGGYGELRPGSLSVLSGSGNGKDKQFKGAKANLSIRAHYPVAAGMSQQQGMTVTASENSETNDASREPEIDDNGSRSMSEMVAVFETEIVWEFESKEAKSEFLLNPKMAFEFDPANSDNRGEGVIQQMDGILMFDLDDGNCSFTFIDEDESRLAVRGEVIFTPPFEEGLEDERFDEWASDEGGWCSCYVKPANHDVEIVDDGGPRLYLRPLGGDISRQAGSGDGETFEAWIKWGYSNDDVEEDHLPPEFREAKRLWQEERIEEAGSLIAPFIRCVFISSNLNGEVTEILDVPDEVEATEVSVYGLDFSETNLPKVKASAKFVLQVTTPLTQERLNEWQEENDMLDNGVSFEWSIEGVDEDLDLCSWNHSGLGMQLAPPVFGRVRCGYEVVRGEYQFLDEETAAAFVESPVCTFDFGPSNVDDKEGLMRIFGTTEPEPKFADSKPKVEIKEIAYSKKDNPLVVIVSACIDMEFDALVSQDEFEDWANGEDSTWRYSGRICCDGEDGLLDSKREEYYFESPTAE